MKFIAIDPGFSAKGEGCAFARFIQGRLRRVWYDRPYHTGVPILDIDEVVVEKPQVDGRTRTATASTLELAWQGALIAGQIAGRNDVDVVMYTPRGWKGSVPKPQVHARLWSVLHVSEKRVLEHSNLAGNSDIEATINAALEKGASKRWKPGVDWYGANRIHNILDAVALGIYHLGRAQYD